MEEDAGTGRRKPTDADGSPEELNTTAHAGFGRFRNAGGRHDPRHQPAAPKRDDLDRSLPRDTLDKATHAAPELAKANRSR